MNASCSKSSMERRYDTGVALRAVFLDIGDTLVEGWPSRERVNELTREALVREFGERDWYDAFVSAEFGPAEGAEAHRQETNRWVEDWFVNSGYGLDDVAVDRLRSPAACRSISWDSSSPGPPTRSAGRRVAGWSSGSSRTRSGVATKRCGRTCAASDWPTPSTMWSVRTVWGGRSHIRRSFGARSSSLVCRPRMRSWWETG